MPFKVEEYVFKELREEESAINSSIAGTAASSNNERNLNVSDGDLDKNEKPEEQSASPIIDKEAIERELKTIIETTKQQALEESRIIKEQAKKEGFELGYREGYEKGLKDAKGIFDKITEEYTQKMQQAIEKLILTAKEISKKYEELENVATDMILDISKKVIANELKVNKDAINSMVKDAIGLTESNKVKIKLNPDDASKLDKELVSNSKDVEIVEDESLKEGSIIIEEENGNVIDASVDTKLEQIKGTLVNE